MDRFQTDGDAFISQYDPSELRIASEFLFRWLLFLSKDLCINCTTTLANRIRSLDLDNGESPAGNEECNGNCYSTISIQSSDDGANANSVGSCKDAAESIPESLLLETPSPRKSWADMAQEDELEEEGYKEQNESNKRVVSKAPSLSREQREHIRLLNVKRKKDFVCLERFKGRPVNVVEGLELHTGVFSAAEQKRIIDYVYKLEEMGRREELQDLTFSAPRKWMKGKGRVTIQFGCCYNYATDKNGNPPGILQNGAVDPLPHLFKEIIQRLVRWHVLPPTCVPDSCIVNIYDEGDCIPPHIDNHDFVRPFCTVSFLSECNILFGSKLEILGPGEFSGPFSIPLPVGSVLVLQGNGADVAKHCVPAVPTKRISITFRRMDESKRPKWFVPEPDLQVIQPLPYEVEKKTDGLLSTPKPEHQSQSQHYRGGPSGGRLEPARSSFERHYIRSEPRVETSRSSDERHYTRSEPRVEAARSSDERHYVRSEPRVEAARSYGERQYKNTWSEPRVEAARSYGERQYNNTRSEPRAEVASSYGERQYNNNTRPEPRFRTQNRQGSANNYYRARVNTSG